MAEIRPFRGIRFNQNIVKDLAQVICPPYDIISPQLQDELYRRSEYNFVRIEYNREQPQDSSQDNRYTRAAETLRHWLEDGVLTTENTPALYIHDHHFNLQGKKLFRRNLIACVCLEEWEKMIIRPHESVLSKPKSDRMSMLWACRANTSPVLAMYEDPEHKVSSAVSKVNIKSVFEIEDHNNEKHVVKIFTDDLVIEQIKAALVDKPIYIADGHHRYDSALSFRRDMVARASSHTGEELYNFVMMSLVAFDDPGLAILPPHRLVRGISRVALSNLKKQLKTFFQIDELPMSSPDIWRKVDEMLPGIRPDIKELRLALFGLNGENMQILTLRDFSTVSGMMPYFHKELYKKLDVSIVDHIILEDMLCITKDKEETVLAYSYDRQDAVTRVRSQEYQLTFILNPVKPELVKAIADANDRMPRKSTYFYPKAPAGLVFYRW